MQAKKESQYNSNRINLGEAIPLEAPLSINIGISGVCNLNCIFCAINDEKNLNPVRDKISLETFTAFIDDLKKFKTKPKALTFAGNGEPLTNAHIVEMIKYAKDAQIFEKIELMTNGVLLNEKLNIQLIEAGLTHLLVSLEAIDDETFEKIARVKVNVAKLTDNLTHFYNNKKQCNVYIKTVNLAVETAEKQEAFYSVFGKISDNIYIENVVQLTEETPQHDERISSELTKFNTATQMEFCPYFFKSLFIDSAGKISACCMILQPNFVLGNIKTDSIYDVWHGEKLRQFRINHLLGNKEPACMTCNPANVSPYDNIDEYAKDILERLQK